MDTTETAILYDAIVVGGSYAGISAAMQLGRARRRVLVIDAGQRRNRFAGKSHGFLGHDGDDAGEIARKARAQLMLYPSVSWLDGAAASARREEGDSFAVALQDGAVVRSRRIILASGVVDELPPVEGLAERWGKTVFHCPYCHGYELDQGRIGVIASGPLSQHHAIMLPDWGRVTLFLNDAYVPDEEQSLQLARRGVLVEPVRVARIVGAASVELVDGRVLEQDGLFTMSRTHIASPLAGQLECELEDGPLGRFIRTEMTKATSVPGVFACGDAGRAAGNVALAVADGAMAGMGVHQSLLLSH